MASFFYNNFSQFAWRGPSICPHPLAPPMQLNILSIGQKGGPKRIFSLVEPAHFLLNINYLYHHCRWSNDISKISGAETASCLQIILHVRVVIIINSRLRKFKFERILLYASEVDERNPALKLQSNLLVTSSG